MKIHSCTVDFLLIMFFSSIVFMRHCGELSCSTYKDVGGYSGDDTFLEALDMTCSLVMMVMTNFGAAMITTTCMMAEISTGVMEDQASISAMMSRL